MKKYLNTEILLSAFAERMRHEILTGIISWSRNLHLTFCIKASMFSPARKFAILLLLCTMTFPAIAPDRNSVIIFKPPPVNPFEPLMRAIGIVETMGNVLAYNEFEGAAGIFQIRQIKVDEYNRQTGNKFSLNDMFDYGNSRKVFLHFASKIGPYNFERIAKTWNGSGPMTEFYWSRIKSYL